MRHSGLEKLEIIRLVEQSDLPVRATLEQLDLAPSSFYRWYRRYLEEGPEGLENRKPCAGRFWNRILDHERERIREVALERPELSPRELAWQITDQEGWYYLSTVPDDYSRYILAWELCTSMSSRDVTETLDLAVERTGVERVQVLHRPRLLRTTVPATCRKNCAGTRMTGTWGTRGASPTIR